MKSKETKCAGGIIYNSKNEIVIVNQNNDSWSLPKGHIDLGETALNAAKREIYEETGIKNIRYIKSLGSFQRYRIGLDGKDDIKEHKTIQIYLFKSEQLELKPLDPNNPEARWVTIDRAYDLLSCTAKAERCPTAQ